MNISGPSSFRFSGHESFPCRYAWLPKACQAILQSSNADVLDEAESGILFDEERAMVALGIGKNMVRSLRFWVEVMGVASPTRERTHRLTPFGRAVFGPDGYDPYLEDRRTLWLLHWNTSTYSTDEPVFAWYHLLNHWPYPELSRAEVVAAFRRESGRIGGRHTEVTLGQHFDVFLHTYVPTRGSLRTEDSLDGPLVELKLLEHVGDRRAGGTGRREPVYAFRREPKSEITPELFEHCIHDYWMTRHPQESTLTYRDIALNPCSVGQVFKLPEEEVRARLEEYVLDDSRPFRYQSSAVQGLLNRNPSNLPGEFLHSVYHGRPSHSRTEHAA